MMKRMWSWLIVMALGLVGLCPGNAAAYDGYDPLSVQEGWTPKTVNLDVRDESRSRTIPIKVYLPESQSPAPVVLFSHGLGGSRENNPYLGNHWSGRGYVVVFIQHPGSDESVWRTVSPSHSTRSSKLSVRKSSGTVWRSARYASDR